MTALGLAAPIPRLPAAPIPRLPAAPMPRLPAAAILRLAPTAPMPRLPAAAILRLAPTDAMPRLPAAAILRLAPTDAILPLAPVAPWAARRLGIARTLPGSGGVVLSFDDGPHPEGTPAILEILAATGACGAFFLVGEQVVRRPWLAARIAAAGHLVALHGHRHRLQSRLPARAVRADLERGAAAVEEATGQRPRWHRPPYGIYSLAGLEAARAAGLVPLLWSRRGRDWRRFTTPGRIAAQATAGVQAGDVILLHDADFYSARGSHRRTAAALPVIIAELGRRGLDTVLPA